MKRKRPHMKPDFPRADIAGQLAGLAGNEGEDAWTDGAITIPRRRAARAAYDKRYLAAVKERYEQEGFVLTHIAVDARELERSNVVMNKARYEMYRQMLLSGATVPPLVVTELVGGTLRILDGNHRTQAAIDARQYSLPALLRKGTA